MKDDLLMTNIKQHKHHKHHKHLVFLICVLVCTLLTLVSCAADKGDALETVQTEPAANDLVPETSGGIYDCLPTEAYIPITVSFDAHKVGENIVKNFRGEYIFSCDNTTVSHTVVDKSKFDHIGKLGDIVSEISNKYTHADYRLYTPDGKIELLANIVDRLGADCDIAASVADNDGRAVVAVCEMTPTVWFDAGIISAGQGAYISLLLYCDMPIDIYADIARRDGGNDILHKSSSFSPIDSQPNDDGLYTYTVNFSVPYIDDGLYYLALKSESDGTPLSSVPLDVSSAEKTDTKLLFEGSWHLVSDDGYTTELEQMFFDLFPRLCRRFGYSTDTTVTFVADPSFNGDAYSVGNKIIVSPTYVNENDDSILGFAKEIAKITLDFGDFSSDWYVENLASYAAFRYYSWAQADRDKLVVYSTESDKVLDWGYTPYGSCEWFFAYVDKLYPTLEDVGLIDGINAAIRSGRLKSDSEQKHPSSELSAVISEITGGKFSSIEELRVKYAADVEDYLRTNGKKGWIFDGFRDFADNAITENIDGVTDPLYLAPSELEQSQS